jgi:molybdate transport system substrate-binding protein
MSSSRRRPNECAAVRVCILAAALFAAAAACGENRSLGRSGAQAVNVFAASSLTAVFEELGDTFEQENPNVDVRFNFLSSSDLAAQIEQGSPADVFASADEPNMERVIEAGLTSSAPEVFAHNELVIIVPPDNPADIDGLEDLTADDLVISLCNEACPAGRYAIRIFDNAGVEVVADSLESEVKAVVTRVSLGEADAGIAYVTDVEAAEGDVEGVPIPGNYNVQATYPIAALKDAPQAAQAFVDLVLSRRGQGVLLEHGFLPK